MLLHEQQTENRLIAEVTLRHLYTITRLSTNSVSQRCDDPTPTSFSTLVVFSTPVKLKII